MLLRACLSTMWVVPDGIKSVFIFLKPFQTFLKTINFPPVGPASDNSQLGGWELWREERGLDRHNDTPRFLIKLYVGEIKEFPVTSVAVNRNKVEWNFWKILNSNKRKAESQSEKCSKLEYTMIIILLGWEVI